MTFIYMLTLTPQDLAELTGRTQPAAQVRWLKQHWWIFETGLDWLPKVATAYFDKRMVQREDALPAIAPLLVPDDWRVNTEALRKSITQ